MNFDGLKRGLSRYGTRKNSVSAADLADAQDCGRKAGRASREKDAARVRFEQDWFNRFLGGREPSEKQELREAFRKAYTEEAQVSPKPFD